MFTPRRRRAYRRGFLIIFLVAGLFAPRFSAAQSDSGSLSLLLPPPRAIPGVGEDVSGRLAELLVETIRRELRSDGIDVRDVPAGTETESDPILELGYYADEPRLFLFASLSDPAGVFGGGIYAGTTDLALVNTLRRAASDIGDQLRGFDSTRDIPYTDPKVLLSVTFSSPDEDSTLLAGDDRRIGVVENGRLRAPFTGLEVGTTVTLVHRKEGYYERQIEVDVTDERMSIDLEPLDPIITRELGGVWTMQRPAGLGFALRGYIPPPNVFIEGEAALSTYYRFTAGSRASAQADTRFMFGGYPLQRRKARVRLSISTGLGIATTVLGTGDGAQWYADPYFVPFSLGLDVSIGSLTPFLRVSPVFYTGPDMGFLTNGLHTYTSAGVRIPWMR